MRLPSDSHIAPGKLRDYLLRPRNDHDKSGFLARAGYGPDSADRLEADLRTQILRLEAEPAGQSPYGRKFVVRGTLTGPNGRSLRVLSVWILDNATGLTRFVTPYPDPDSP
jgi:hypothetical protein